MIPFVVQIQTKSARHTKYISKSEPSSLYSVATSTDCCSPLSLVHTSEPRQRLVTEGFAYRRCIKSDHTSGIYWLTFSDALGRGELHEMVMNQSEGGYVIITTRVYH